jgi:hypothetical protein
MKLSSMFALVAMTGLLAACGGGGSPAPAPVSAPVAQPDAVDKYIGTWGTCYWGAGLGSRTSWTHSMTLTKTSATSATLTIKRQGSYANDICSGSLMLPLTTPLTATGSITITGQKQIGSDTVDTMDYLITESTIMILPANKRFKDIAMVVGTTLKGGDDTSSLDTGGYPTALDSVDVLIKQ